MIPLHHQKKFIKGYKGKNILAHEGGTGKTICACLWLKDGRDSDALVICPKRVVKKWQETLILWGAKALVVSKEDFKKLKPRKWSAIVMDEADEFASPLFAKGRSQRTKIMYELLRFYPTQTLLLTATPIRSNPWNLHTLLCFSGRYIDWRKWRDEFFSYEHRPYLPRPAWLPRSDWRKRIRPVLERYADIVLLKDCVGTLPAVTEKTVKVKSDPFEPTEWEGSAAFSEEHRHEQKNKIKELLEIGKEYRKVMVVAYYREQCESLARELANDRETFMIMGGVKDQEETIRKAQESDECYFVVQASLGAGFDANTFSCVVFASMSYAVRDFVQMKFRVRRVHDLHPVIFYYLLGGECDKAVFANVLKGKDFVPSEYKYEPATIATTK